VLKPTLTELYDWTEGGYANTALVFQAFYGLGFLFFGRLIDRIGPRWGYMIAMGLWTVAHMGHALVTSTRDFALMRIPLAIGESGTYPAALAATSQWFNLRERALAIGIFNAGANLGAIITPLLVPVLVLSMGWQSAFIVTGLFNLVWIASGGRSTRSRASTNGSSPTRSPGSRASRRSTPAARASARCCAIARPGPTCRAAS
jgi:ACS family hexuronate transporter-like MFS transporter